MVFLFNAIDKIVTKVEILTFGLIYSHSTSVSRLPQVFHKSSLKIDKQSLIKFGKNVQIKNTKILVEKNSILCIDDNSILDGYLITVRNDSKLCIGRSTLLQKVKSYECNIYISGHSYCSIGSFSRIRGSISGRHNSFVQIGNKVYLNQGSQLRSHQSIKINGSIPE